MGDVKVLESVLKTRPATQAEQDVLDIRIEEIGQGKRKDEDLFDKEEGKKEEPPKKKEGEPKKTEDGKLSDTELLEAKNEDLNDEQKTRKADLVKAKDAADKEADEERILNAKDEDLDEKEKGRKAELIKLRGGERLEKEKKEAFNEEAKAYATENKVSEEDARKDLESIGKIVENFKGDPKKLAKSLHHLQRITSKTQEDLKTLQNAPPPMPTQQATIKSVIEMIEAGEMTIKGKPATKEQVVEVYREKNKDIDDTVSDDMVIKLLAKDMVAIYETERQENLTKLSSEAKGKKAKLIDGLSEADKKFLPAIKSIVDNHTDSQIMSEKYSFEDVIFWAKGKEYDSAIKDAEEKGFKRGIEARKIIGEIKPPAEGKTKIKGKGKGSPLTDAQKREAEAMFATDDIPLETKYKHYEEILAHGKALEDKNKKKEE